MICAANGDPQLDVVDQAGDPAECDLFIGLPGHTMGGMLPEKRFGRSPAERAWNSTEWEIEQAVSSTKPGRRHTS